MRQPRQPLYILPQDTKRDSGKNAQIKNINAGIEVAETVRTTLGPKGMDKMLVDSIGDITITNDGVTILEKIQVDHPAAKMLVEVSKTQEQEVGDGTTTAAVITGELLKQAKNLIEKNIHPTIIANGYRLSSQKATQILNELDMNIDIIDEELKKVTKTAMTGKSAEIAEEKLSNILIKAVNYITQNRKQINRNGLKLLKKTGGSVENSELIKGIGIKKERLLNKMPSIIKDAKILLINSPLEIKEPETNTKININNPRQLQQFLEEEETKLKKMADNILTSNANIIFCRKGIDETIQHILAKNNISAIRQVKEKDMNMISKATSAEPVNDLEKITENELGYAGLIKEEKIGDNKYTFIEKCKNPKNVTLLLRGGTEHVTDEVERAVIDAIGDLISVIQDEGKIVAGGGSSEIEVSKKLLKYSDELTGREQLAVRSYAKALEIIPTTLAENAGLDPINVLVALKSKHQKQEDSTYGLNVFTGKITDMRSEGVIEPLRTKLQAIKSATEAAIMILRIDDVISAKRKRQKK